MTTTYHFLPRHSEAPVRLGLETNSVWRSGQRPLRRFVLSVQFFGGAGYHYRSHRFWRPGRTLQIGWNATRRDAAPWFSSRNTRGLRVYWTNNANRGFWTY